MTASGGSRLSKSENTRIRNAIVDMYKSFVSEVDPKDVLDLLIQKRVISIERKDEVMSKVIKQDRCRALLDQLFSCSNDEAFLVLRQALDENYHWFVERIDQSKSANNKVISSGNLELPESNEVKLTQQLDEANRRITELEKEVNKYQRKTLVLKSELSFMQDSCDESLKRELKLKDQLASLRDWATSNESEDDDFDASKPVDKQKTQRGEGSASLFAPPSPPDLPKRPPTNEVEFNKKSVATADIVQDTILPRPQLLTVIQGSTPGPTGNHLFKETIGNRRYLTSSVYKDELMAHIREYDEENGKSFPTKKGASFNKAAWVRFLSHFNEIERNVELLKSGQAVNYYQHVGGRYYVSINKEFKCVNIRRYFLPPNSTRERPTRSGIALRLEEWDLLLKKIPLLHDRLPELKNASSCNGALDHVTQMDWIACNLCNPFQTKA